MKIQNLRIQNNRYFIRAIASLTWEDCARKAQEIYFEVPNRYGHLLACNPDAFFVACSIPAMYYGEKRIYMEEAICPELKASMQSALTWIYQWFRVGNPNLKLDCPVRDRIEPLIPPRRTGSFFTGGIDSWANLLQNHSQYPSSHPRHIKDFFMVYGLQRIRRHNFERAVVQFQNIGDSLGVDFIPVYTNIYAHLINEDVNYSFWKDAYNGAALAAIGHAFHQHYDTISIASSHDIANLVPLGTHPNLDPNYSSYNLRITHDGLTLSRLSKTKLVSQSEIALQNLRVCDDPNIPDNKQNCGACEKCVRTTATLEALDCLKKTEAFPYQTVTPQIANGAYVRNTGIEQIYLDLIPLLEARGKREIAQVLKSKIRRFNLERLDQKLCGGLIFGFARRLKSLLSRQANSILESEVEINLSPSYEE